MLLRCFFLGGIFLGSSYFLLAQTIYVSGNQVLSLTNNAVLYTPSSVVNEGMLLNDGSVQLNGDWDNQQSYTGDGWLRLTGSSDQTVQHNSQVLGSLEISGGGSKTVNGNVTINDTLNLVSGFVIATAPNIVQLNQGLRVENASENSYIQGAVQFHGTGYHFLPIGTNDAFLPVILEDVSGIDPLTEVTPFSNQQLEVEGERLETKTVSNYWTVTNLEGSYEGSVVTLPVTTADSFNDLTASVIVESESSDGLFTNLGQRDREGDSNGGLITSEAIASRAVVALGFTSEYVLENSVEVPSAFSPIAPNLTNRSVKIYSANLQADGFSFTIFNRWGQIVFQTNDLQLASNSGWSGLDASTNQPLPAGLYPYVLRGNYDTGRAVEKTGSITLFR